MKNVIVPLLIMGVANRELEDYANKRIPLPKKSLSTKDEDLLKKVSMIASAVKVDEPPIVAPDINELYITEEVLRRELPSEKRILVDELYKILYFNNQDPETVSPTSYPNSTTSNSGLTTSTLVPLRLETSLIMSPIQ